MLRIEERTQYVIIEMGASGAGEIARLVSIATPDVAVVLKVGLAHAGEFGGIEATQRAKAELVTELPPDAVAVLNVDDPRVAVMTEQTAARVAFFGLTAGSDVRAEAVHASATRTRFTLARD